MSRILALLVSLLLSFSGCDRPDAVELIRGETMGTTYQVSFVSRETTAAHRQELVKAIDALLAEINQSLSTYIENSTISRINASTDLKEWQPIDQHFDSVLQRSRDIYQDTKGAFNPAVGPLVNAWGFGPEEPDRLPDAATVEALRKVVDFDSFAYRQFPPALRKHIASARLDFNAIAKGYGVDAVGLLLEQRGVISYIVEIGGEVRARGHHPDRPSWRVGVEKPTDDALADKQIKMVIELKDAALATSGTYRNYDISEGKKISHIIDPKTGYPAQNSLLSVSVIAPDAVTADAYATALIVMGLDEGLRFVEARKGLAAYFIATDNSGKLVERRSSAFPAPVND
ncbi:MAG TPA: FAD:protein FMN transferase [Terriglobia bacterium]|nr:FAD:protein FMN transferase [Terriglobia bacterium]